MAENPRENLVTSRKKNVSRASIYKRNVIQKSLRMGLEYTGHGGKLVQKNITGPDCNCRMKCFQNVTQPEREEVFLYLYSHLSTKDEQDRFMQTLIEKHDCKRRRSNSVSNRRTQSLHFFVYIPSIPIKKRVCRKAFLSMYALSKKRLSRLHSLNKQGIVAKDMRGKKLSTNALPVDQKIMVSDHIKSFPKKETHYSGRVMEYLDARLDVKKMHKLFKSKYPASPIKYEYYLNIFKDNFSLRFGRPQIDTCVTCEELQVKLKNPHLGDNAKRANQAELDLHKRRAKKITNTLNDVRERCRADDDICGIAFDYMQNLPLPHIPVQDIFYLRQLWVNVFCIHDLRTDATRFYVYHEGQAKKGANEVCSFLLDYIKEVVPQKVKKLYLFSDGPTGQNKNHTMVRMCAALVESGRFEQVVQNYPIRGHSWLPCDRDFGCIKRAVKKIDRVYSPKEYVEIIVQSFTKKNVEVKMVSAADILLVDSWWQKFYKKNCVSEETRGRNIPADRKVNFTITTFMEFIHDKNLIGCVKTRPFIGNFIEHTFKIRSQTEPIELPQQKAYPEGRVAINPKKIDDLKAVLKYIPVEHLEFYNEITEWLTIDDVNTEIEIRD